MLPPPEDDVVELPLAGSTAQLRRQFGALHHPGGAQWVALKDQPAQGVGSIAALAHGSRAMSGQSQSLRSWFFHVAGFPNSVTPTRMT